MTKMNILGLETSCDDTAAAIYRGGVVLAESVSTQLMHAEWGGVVPEIASRAHLKNILPVVDTALKDAGMSYKDLNCIAVTAGPGLAGALLVGLNFGRGLADGLKIPLFGINHLQAHIRAAEIGQQAIEFPFISLIVSGGHTSIVRVDGIDKYTTIGQTLDDAAGEALDKIGKLLGLTYPAGAEIERLSSQGDPASVKLPRGMTKSGDLNFSFSGLKTAARIFLEKNPQYLEAPGKFDFLASLQEAVLDILVQKSAAALQREKLDTLVLGGGVSANKRLKSKLSQIPGLKLIAPQPRHSTDNGAMVAHYAYKLMQAGHQPKRDLTAAPDLGMEEGL